MCTITFIIIDVYSSFYLIAVKSRYDILVTIGISILPAISNNILYSYISRKFSYKPVIFLKLIMQLYTFVLPIIPNTNYYITSLILLWFPVLLNIKLIKLKQEIDDKELEREDYKRKYGGLIVAILFLIVLVYFYSGYFKYHAVAIGSGSMNPIIKYGDVVIINKEKSLYDLDIGEIIAYWNENHLIVHRIVERKEQENGKVMIITKGDANENNDIINIDESNYYGVIHYKIPYIGLPTIWVNELISE